MAITAKEVNELRKATGAGMMDCKKALVESEGDMEAAVDILRKKGQKIAAKRGDREANEGYVLAQTTADGKRGVVLVLNCETDFVAKNEDFGKLAASFMEIAINEAPADVEAFKALKFDDKLTVGEKITEQTGVIGEKLDISSYESVSAEQVVAYIHPGNRLATVVGLSKASDAAADAGKQVAMQVAAMAPIAVDKEGVDQATIDREIEVGKDLAIQEGKPAEMAEKIAMGRLNKFFKENTLLNQEFVRDNKVTIKQMLENAEGGLTVTEFKRISLA